MQAEKYFDEQYIKDFFTKKILPLYPDFLEVLNLRIIAHKKNVWEKSHHMVIEYRTKFLGCDGRIRQLPIYCSTHSEESRRGVYESLRFLWDKGFNKGYLSIPHPLLYSDEFQGVFYRGVDGHNLYYYIKQGDKTEIESIVKKSARWFAKLHRMTGARNFNPLNSRIETVLPGLAHILERMSHDYPELEGGVRHIYDIINNKEKDFFKHSEKQWLVHGDAHPENIIRMSPRKIAIIDFTDLCLSDFTRDLGSFTQQLEFMIMRKIKDQAFSDKMKKLFLDTYFSVSNDKLSTSVEERIENYYYWTSMRTAIYYLIKGEAEPQRAFPLIEKTKKHLGLV